MSKFIEICLKKGYLEEGSRNNNLPAMIRVAKTHGLEKQEALTELKNEGGWKMEKSDINSFSKGWEKFEPADEYLQDAWKKNLSPKVKLDLNPIEKKEYELLEYFFKPTDNVCLGLTPKIYCIETLSESFNAENKEEFEKFQLMSIATFKEKGEMNVAHRDIENVKENRYYLIESDTLTLDEQREFAMKMLEFGLPVKSIVESGHKSIHILLKTAPTSVEEWSKDGERIKNAFNALQDKLVDPLNFEPSRFTRLPNGFRRLEDESMKRQKLVWLDNVKAADDDWSKYAGLADKVVEFVTMLNGGKPPIFFNEELEKGNFKKIESEVKASADFAIDFKDKDCPIDDIFYNGKDLYASFKDDRGMMATKMSVLSGAIVPFIKPDVKKVLCSHNAKYVKVEKGEKEEKEKKEKKIPHFNLGMIDIPIKSFTFKMTLDKLPTMKNSFEPGFIVEAVKKQERPKECPSEFEKLLDNLADEKCKKWLVNHLACYFWLLKNNFQRNGGLYVLQTVPVFVGPQGTGKTTLAMMIGNAICKDGYRDVSLEQLSNAQFNDFFESGCMAVNEVGATSLERKGSRNALKRWTDPKVTVNKKHIAPYTIDNTAYKVMTANASVYGVLSLDQGENRRWQYIEGGKGLRAEEVIDFELLEQQKVDFFSWILSQQPDFSYAQRVFDTETKLQDLELSKSKVEVVAEWLDDWLKSHSDWPGFTVKGVKLAYEDETGERTDAVTNRTLSLLLTKRYGKPAQTGKDLILYKETLSRGSRYWPNPYFKEKGLQEGLSIPLDLRLDPNDSDEF